MKARITIPRDYPEPEVGQSMPYWSSQMGRNCLITPISFTSFDNADGSTVYTIDGTSKVLTNDEYRQWLALHPQYLEFEQAPPE